MNALIEEDRRTPSKRLGLGMGIAIWLVIGLAMLGWPRVVFADETNIAIEVEGANADDVRNMMLVALPVGTTVVEESAFRTALAAQGQRGPVGAGLDGDARGRTVAIVRKAAAASGLYGAFVVHVAKDKQHRTVVILYVSALRAAADREGEIALGPKRAKEDAAKLAAFVKGALEADNREPQESKPAAPQKAQAVHSADAAAQTQPAPTEPAPQPAPETPAHVTEIDSASSARPRGVIAHALFDIEVGGEAAGRRLDYHDAISNNLRSYNVFPAALFTANAEVFPFADSKGILRDLGLMGQYSRSLFLNSTTSRNLTLHTVESSYVVGVRARIRPLEDARFVLGISDGYASQAVDFDRAQGPIDAQVPAVNCSANRTAADVRIPFGNVSLLAAVGYRVVFDCGAIAQRFRRSSVGGIDGALGGALALAQGWEARLVADYERYFYAFSPVPGDSYVAGGALDQFFGARLGLAYIF